MVTNHMLVYKGYSPSMALTGAQPRDLYDIENISVSSVSGALETQLDFVESHMRARFIVKESILEAIVEDRLARAEATKVQQHTPEDLARLVDGAKVDLWREPSAKR